MKTIVDIPPYQVDDFSGPAGLPMVQFNGIDENGKRQRIVLVRSVWEDVISHYLAATRDRDTFVPVASDTVCWDCIKGRHIICPNVIPDDDEHIEDRGKKCECPVCHANRYESRQPVWDGTNTVYYDPGPSHEPRGQ